MDHARLWATLAGTGLLASGLAMAAETEAAETAAAGEGLLSLSQPDEPAAEPEERDIWSNRITASLSLTDGNTENFSTRIGVRSVRETDNDTLRLGGFGYYESDDGEESANEIQANIGYDRFLFEERRWFVFGEGGYEYDEFEEFLHRATAIAGPGYRLIVRDDLDVSLRGGLGGRRDFGRGADTTIEPEAMAGFDVDWNVTEGQQFIARNRSFLSLSDTRDYRIVSSAEYSILMSELAEGLSFNIGLEHEYEQRVPNDVDESDVRLFAGLAVDF